MWRLRPAFTPHGVGLPASRAPARVTGTAHLRPLLACDLFASNQEEQQAAGGREGPERILQQAIPFSKPVRAFLLARDGSERETKTEGSCVPFLPAKDGGECALVRSSSELENGRRTS
ncbi:hypothetical protein IEQ34_020291 [Dendrobium chrysotoxum]|uniref:Uncharacterized protein n=1 Tax=Dendrobium chrysotoxum TaxID=161865 RepID=A0AAV7G205_DENCH|nr:hypothetical protein IEQ34_020291 [Dendrobium chrysotoxum]